jgi:hypothetical protein
VKVKSPLRFYAILLQILRPNPLPLGLSAALY